MFTFKVLFSLGCHKQKEEEYIAECRYKELLSGGDVAWLKYKRIKEKISSRGNTMNRDSRSSAAR